MNILTSSPSGATPPKKTLKNRADFPSGAARLGSYTKSTAKTPNQTQQTREKPAFEIDESTGEIVQLGKPEYDQNEERAKRYAIQSVARRFLPKSRTAKCHRVRYQHKDVEIWKSKEHKGTSFAGLIACGSVWTCPVCAAKIAERRRIEVRKALDAHKADGGTMYMMTLTAPHTRDDALGEILKKQEKALAFFNKDGTARRVFKSMGIVGTIRAMEVTHGRKSSNNGWHPHYHVLQFSTYAAPDCVREQWADTLYTRWAAACEKAGLKRPSREHGLKIDGAESAGNYVSKWGLEDEATKGHTKKSAKGETPFDFLRAYLSDGTDKQAAALFVEFAESFKGKRQLYWSAGLKKRFEIGDFSDEELAIKIEDSAVLLGSLTVEQWRDVIWVEGRAELLWVAATGGWDAVLAYLDGLIPKRPKGRNVRLGGAEFVRLKL